MNKTFVFTPTQQTNDIERLIQTNTSIQINKVERKLHNKILGFRSNTKWKMVVASAVYLFIVIAAISGFMDKKENKVASSTPKQEAKIESQSDTKKETNSKPQDTVLKMDDGRNVTWRFTTSTVLNISLMSQLQRIRMQWSILKKWLRNITCLFLSTFPKKMKL